MACEFYSMNEEDWWSSEDLLNQILRIYSWGLFSQIITWEHMHLFQWWYDHSLGIYGVSLSFDSLGLNPDI